MGLLYISLSAIGVGILLCGFLIFSTRRMSIQLSLVASKLKFYNPVGWSRNVHGTRNFSDRCAASAFTPNVSVA